MRLSQTTHRGIARQIKNKGIQKRESTLSATHLAKKISTPVWPSNAVFEASPVYGVHSR